MIDGSIASRRVGLKPDVTDGADAVADAEAASVPVSLCASVAASSLCASG